MPKLRNKGVKEYTELVSYGNLLLPPVVPNIEIFDLGKLLDNFYKTYPLQHKRQKASDLILGAYYAIRPECRSNPDWMSQAANSARDVLYPLLSTQTARKNLIGLFNKYATNKNNKNKELTSTFIKLNEIYKKLSDITHHGTNLRSFSVRQYLKLTDSEFEKLLSEYTLILKNAFSLQQIYVHSVVDIITKSKNKNKLQGDIDLIINVNEDAKQYFFNKADERWLGWLWKNGFLSSIKDDVSDSNSYGFKMPELNYLISVSVNKPDMVTKIICSFDISIKNFNPEVVDQFIRISGKLPARCLKRIVKKIKDEKWIKLMGKYIQYGFDYEDMLKILQKANYSQSILILAEAMLQIRSEEDLKERKDAYKDNNVFYIHNISETRVFKYLAEIPDKYQEKALSIVINTLVKSIKDQGNYLLMDEDFFSMSLNTVSGDSYGEELKFLVATVIDITRKLFSDQKQNKKELYMKYFVKLPKNQIIRRLKLFVLSLDPPCFIEELKIEYFKLFETEKIMGVLYGAEYERALKAGFSYLSNSQKREYIAKVLSIFSKPKDDEDKRWKRHYASCILSTIQGQLTKGEIALAEKNGFKIDPKYEPEPSIGKIRGGTVTPKSPLTSDDFATFTIKDIAVKLKEELSPSELQKKYKNDDFLNPRNADGVAEQLKSDIKNRVGDYLENATLFFDREKLIPHYTNAYLRGIKDVISEKRNELVDLKYEELFELLLAIKKSGEEKSFGKTEERWLSNWDSVLSTISDLLEELIKQKDKKTLLNFKIYRNKILDILSYLFNFDDPVPEDEKIEKARMTTKRAGEKEYSISDPFSIAINSIRGRAFQLLLHFIYQDASNFENIRLADDVKTLYNNLLEKEKTRAIMFMFGHYLPSFYFRDIEWTKSKFSEIFKSKTKDKYLNLAAWEGYLSTNLFNELFFDKYIQKLYKKNISLNLSYPKQNFFKDPHESLAIHLALAFVHYEKFGFDNNLFKVFLDKASEKQLAEFISFLGRSYLAGENYNVLKDRKSSWRIKRIKNFWELMLKVKNGSPSLKEFGSWIDVEHEVLNIKWLAEKISLTLKATNGELKWDYGLMKSIERLAAEASESTLKILEKHFIWLIKNEKQYIPVREDKEWFNAFKILYKNENKKINEDTYSLINKLIEKGGRQFWILEDIIKQNG